MTEAVLEARQVSKRYPGVQALQDVSLALRAGEVHALVGENGAGKSTLIRTLAGVSVPDSGTIAVDGVPVKLTSPAAARRAGIVAIFQELSLVPWLSVAENVSLGRESGRAGVIDYGAMRETATRTFNDLGVVIDLRSPTAKLSTAERQLVEIARALSASARVLIMDEPTSSLPGSDAERLLDIVRRLRDQGTAVLFVSHRLQEVLSIADRISVMRGGRLVATLDAASCDIDGLIELMVGQRLSDLFPPPRPCPESEVVLEARSLTARPRFSNVSFEVRRGEVIGFAGLIGAGRSEVMRALCGIDPLQTGDIFLDGRPVRFRRPRHAIRHGVIYVPEDRKEDGLIMALSGYENAGLASYRRFERAGFLSRARLNDAVQRLAERLRVRGRLERPARTLSGGNQQKIVLGRWLLAGARILILDEPTRGIDIGAKRDLYHLIREFCDEGLGVVLVSSELPELLHLADRIVVMSGGTVTDTLERDEFDEQRILRAAFAAHTVRHAQTAA